MLIIDSFIVFYIKNMKIRGDVMQNNRSKNVQKKAIQRKKTKEDVKVDPNATKVFALGGLNEVGKNMYCIEHKNELIIIDSGVRFAEDDIPGIDYIIPDYTYLAQNQDKIKALLITHGHEDHIGGIPFLLQKITVPMIYASPLATALIKRKLEERKPAFPTSFTEINDESVIKTTYFNIGFFRTTHSIPESLGIVINTPNGRVVSTGDFKFDLTPVGEEADLQVMSFLGTTGVTLLMSDSTNSEIEAFSISEKKVSNAIQNIFRKTEGRLIVATFASNVHRVQQIVEAAIKFDRRILIYGRSMENVIQTSRNLGYIKCPDRYFINNDQAKRMPDEKILILCTGSQGEPLAALSRIAAGVHKFVTIKPGDTVVFSSSAIPGNATSINKVVNKLFRSGANVLTNSALNSIHTSGHGSQEEQKLMLMLMKPKYFMPMHGEYRMLKIHAQLSQEVGIDKDNSFVMTNGDTILLKNNEAYRGPRVHADDIYVDGNDTSGLSTAVLHDRQILSQDGMVSILISMDSRSGKLLHRPVIISRGFVYMKDSKTMIYEAEKLVQEALKSVLSRKTTFGEIKNKIRDTLSPYFYRLTNRNPMIIPVIMNKK